MDVTIEKVETFDELKDLLRELRVEKRCNDNHIAAELNRLKVKPVGWTAFRVRCAVKALKIYRKWGRKSAAEEAARHGRPRNGDAASEVNLPDETPRRPRRPPKRKAAVDIEIPDGWEFEPLSGLSTQRNPQIAQPPVVGSCRSSR